MSGIFKSIVKACSVMLFGDQTPPPKPTWDSLRTILQDRQSRLVEEFSIIKVRFNKSTISRFENIEQLDSILHDQLLALKNKQYAVIKTQTAFRDAEQFKIGLDDYLLTDERYYVKGAQLDDRTRILIQNITEIIALRDSDFNCKIMINQHFENILLEYWELYVNSLK